MNAPKTHPAAILAATRTLAVTTIATAIALAVLGIYLVHARLPSSALRLVGEHELGVARFLPQGWKFFTKSPRDPEIAVFTRDEAGEWDQVNDETITSSGSFLWLDRSVRARGVEMALLVHDVPATAWRMGCRGPDVECLDGLAPAMEVESVSPAPTMCGTVGFVSRPPVPWMWARSGAAHRMPAMAVVLRVRC